MCRQRSKRSCGCCLRPISSYTNFRRGTAPLARRCMRTASPTKSLWACWRRGRSPSAPRPARARRQSACCSSPNFAKRTRLPPVRAKFWRATPPSSSAGWRGISSSAPKRWPCGRSASRRLPSPSRARARGSSKTSRRTWASSAAASRRPT